MVLEGPYTAGSALIVAHQAGWQWATCVLVHVTIAFGVLSPQGTAKACLLALLSLLL